MKEVCNTRFWDFIDDFFDPNTGTRCYICGRSSDVWDVYGERYFCFKCHIKYNIEEKRYKE